MLGRRRHSTQPQEIAHAHGRLLPFRRSALTVLLAAVVGLAPAAARAQSSASGPDEVTLKGGGFVRGTIVSAEPGHEVVILLMGTGTQRAIPWEEVAGFQRGKYSPTSAPMPVVKTSPAPAYGTPGYVRMHIDTASPDVQLFRVHEIFGTDDGGETRDSICHAPCDAEVDGRGDATFRIGGEGITMSPAFVLSNRTGDVSLHVDPGSRGRWMGGLILGSTGAAGLVGGIVLIASGKARNSETPAPGFPTDSGNGRIIGGSIAVGVGAVATAVGIWLMLSSRSHVSFTTPPEKAISSRPLPQVARALLVGPLVSF